MDIKLPNLPKVNKQRDADNGADVEAPSLSPKIGKKPKKERQKKQDDISLFPTPKQAVTIYTPIVHVITQTINPDTGSPLASPNASFIQGAWKDYVKSSRIVPGPAAATTNTFTGSIGKPMPKKRRIKVKLGSMVVKMLNRLVAENVIAHDRVFLSRNATHILVRVLAGERTVPILLTRCERIGVGVVVGEAYGTALEWSMVPNVTEELQSGAKPFSLDALATPATSGDIEGDIISRTPSTAAAAGGVARENTRLEVTLDKEKDAIEGEKEDDDEDEEAEEVSISSEDDVDDGEEDYDRNKVNSATPKFDDSTTTPGNETGPLSSERKEKLGQLIADARREWLDTGSRLRVLQVLESVEAGAALTFDYVAYVILAAWVAAMGLISNSVAVVVASMLLSPLMGPCLGATLGFTLRKKKLVKLGLLNECLSLVMCIFVGLIVGAFTIPSGAPIGQAWPSSEMTGRGTVNGLVMAIFVALPSGAGVALSVLGRNSGGLTGVAISLSLLPPAVNAGVCWMAAIFYSTGAVQRASGDDTNYGFVGAMSLCLTLVNICCIFIGGCTMFALKEVAPVKNKNTFWSRDVKIVRKHRKKEIDPNTKAIKLGVKAALELQEALAKEGKLHTEGEGQNPLQYKDSMRLATARRKGLAANVLEDALFVGGGAFVGGGGLEAMDEIIPGGAISPDLFPDEETYLDDATVDTDKESLLDAAGKVGGLEGAGELLFSSFANETTDQSRVRTSTWDDRLGDYGIVHEDVAGAVLWS